MIELGQLIAAGVPPTQAREFLVPLRIACQQFDINTPARLAGFISQCRVESLNFTRLEENLYYTTPERIRAVFPSRVTSLQEAATLTRNPKALANRVYANRLGNGNEESGDGWAYRGRGIIQLTGRDNYTDAAAEMGHPYVESPDLLLEPLYACMTAAWYWWRAKGNLLADSSQWDAITRAVNGPAMMHADLRRQYADEAAGAFA